MTEVEKIHEIRRLIDETYRCYFANSEDGHCKSSEGHLTVALDYDNYFAREDRRADGKEYAPPSVYVEIYSYLFCSQGRRQVFESIDEALEEVRGWHKEITERDWKEWNRGLFG